MPKKNSSAALKALAEKENRIKAQEDRLKADRAAIKKQRSEIARRVKREERAKDGARNALRGAMFGEWLRHDGAMAARAERLFDLWLMRDRDRALFGLEPLTEAELANRKRWRDGLKAAEAQRDEAFLTKSLSAGASEPAKRRPPRPPPRSSVKPEIAKGAPTALPREESTTQH